MDATQFRNRLISALALAVFASHGAPAGAQCAPTLYSSSSGPPVFIAKSVPAATMCTLTAFNNADCHPGGNFPPVIGAMTTGTSLLVSATQVTFPATLPSPSCGWVCNCTGTPSTVQVTTNSTNDGLPVELMDFTVEGDAAEGDEGDEPSSGTARAGAR